MGRARRAGNTSVLATRGLLSPCSARMCGCILHTDFFSNTEIMSLSVPRCHLPPSPCSLSRCPPSCAHALLPSSKVRSNRTPLRLYHCRHLHAGLYETGTKANFDKASMRARRLPHSPSQNSCPQSVRHTPSSTENSQRQTGQSAAAAGRPQVEEREKESGSVSTSTNSNRCRFRFGPRDPSSTIMMSSSSAPLDALARDLEPARSSSTSS